MATLDKLSLCKQMKSLKSFGYRIPKIINVTLNDRSKAKLVYKGNVSLDLEPPITLGQFVQDINTSTIPGRIIKPYTYAIIRLQDILYLSLFQEQFKTIEKPILTGNGTEISLRGIDSKTDIGQHIINTLERFLQDYIILGSDGYKYIVFFKVVGSNIELFNKHGSMVFFLKNIILDHLCEFLDEQKLQNADDFNTELFDVYFYNGVAGEFILSRETKSLFQMNYNFLSGTLMELEYNTDYRNSIFMNSISMLMPHFNPSYRYKLMYKNTDLIPKNMDQTYDAIQLLRRGVKLYYIQDPELIRGILRSQYLTNISRLRMALNTLSTLIRTNKLNPSIVSELVSMSKNIQLSSFSLDLNTRIQHYIQELSMMPDIQKNQRLMTSIENVHKQIEVLHNDFRIKQAIQDLFIPSNQVDESQLKRPTMKGGKKRKRTRKYKKRNNRKKIKSRKKTKSRKTTKKQ